MINDNADDLIIARFFNESDGQKLFYDGVIASSYKIVKDFYTGTDIFSIEFEDDRADQLLDFISQGMRVSFESRSGIVILIGLVDWIHLAPNRSGKHLTIRGRDILGVLEDQSIFPNLGSGSDTYQFKPENTLEFCLNKIFESAPQITKVVINDDVKGLTISTGFGIGIRQQSKTGRGLAKNFQSNLDHLLKPEKSESILNYAKRLATRCGCIIRMMPGTDDTIVVSPPTYDRTIATPFQLNRYITQNSLSNVLESSMEVNYKDQPSILICEGSHGSPTFKKTTQKVICINEFTGYGRGKPLTIENVIPDVKIAIDNLTSGTNGYILLDVNEDLESQIPKTIIDLKTSVSRLKYLVDNNAQTLEELKFYCAEQMATYQDQYFVLDYEVVGHSQNGIFWAPNMLVNVYDESFHSSKTINGSMWIRRVEFIRNRHEGTTTKLTLNLPYIHQYNIINE